jgi:hypothetical protein
VTASPKGFSAGDRSIWFFFVQPAWLVKREVQWQFSND